MFLVVLTMTRFTKCHPHGPVTGIFLIHTCPIHYLRTALSLAMLAEKVFCTPVLSLHPHMDTFVANLVPFPVGVLFSELVVNHCNHSGFLCCHSIVAFMESSNDTGDFHPREANLSPLRP